VVRVKQIVYRNSPTLFGDPPMRPLLSWGGDLPAAGAEVWDHLERSGVTDITGVWGHCRGLMMVISLKQRYAGHAMQALFAANGLKSSRSMFPSLSRSTTISLNFKDVLWAIPRAADRGSVSSSGVDRSLDPRLTTLWGRVYRGAHSYRACKPFGATRFPRPISFQRKQTGRQKALGEARRRDGRREQSLWAMTKERYCRFCWHWWSRSLP
jgi:4-hydroxy-3-polyprenylbenzoate decarboxylase